MRKKKRNEPSDTGSVIVPDGNEQSRVEFDSDIPDFTAEQWSWLKERAMEYEEGYLPTRTLIKGM